MPEEKRIDARNVMGGIVGIGGQQTFHGAVTVTIRDMTQTIHGSPNADETAKAELDRLVEQLREALQQVPPDKAGDTQTVARRTEELVSEATQPQPDKEAVEFKGNKLKQAAENLRDAMPVVMQIATGIVAHAGRFAQ